MMKNKAMRTVSQTANVAVVACVCSMMVVPQAMLAEDPMMTPPPSKAARTTPLTSQEKTLHALNRLTFGPKPGDEAAVNKMGLEAWFQQQLNPSTINDSALDVRLEAFPAMKLSQQELMERFPSPQVVRNMMRQGKPLPSDPVLHAIYGDAEASYEKKLNELAPGQPQAQAGQKPADATMQSSDASMKADGDMAGDMAMTPTVKAAGKGKGKKSAQPMSAPMVTAVLALEPADRMTRLVGMSPEEMLSFRAGLKPYERFKLMQGFTPAQVEVVAAMEGPARVVGAEALESRLVRDVYSDRQLQAVMTDFWLNHFSVYVKKNQNEPYYLPSYQRDVILPNALGHFENLLVATAQSPAMLMYLDNWESVGPDSAAAKRVDQLQKARPDGQLVKQLPKGINENYARELMELHTLGVGGGYTQKDVIEVAKCFTGWTLDKPYQGGGKSAAIFDEQRHEDGAKVVLGQTIPSGGQQEGLTVLHMLATSPQTAKFISTKLAVRFVSDHPPASLVDKMTATFLKTNGDIKAVLSTMFHAPEFWSPAVYRAKVKTPIEFMASALRASDANINNALPLVQAMDRLGMPIYGMQTPNGYSWMQSEWVSSNALISRMNFALVLSGDRVPGTRTDWAARVGAADTAPTPASEAKLETMILGEPAGERTRSTVLDQARNPTAQHAAEQNFNAKPADPDVQDMIGGQAVAGRGGRRGPGLQASDAPETPLDTMAGLLLGSPDFQRR